jgi:hypothetical protein
MGVDIMTKQGAVYDFYSKFGIDCYEENSVPHDATFPYLTYDISVGGFDTKVATNVNLWYRETTWKNANAKENEIYNYLGIGGVYVTYDDGAIWFNRGEPFSNHLGDDSDDMIKRILINITLEYIDK